MSTAAAKDMLHQAATPPKVAPLSLPWAAPTTAPSTHPHQEWVGLGCEHPACAVGQHHVQGQHLHSPAPGSQMVAVVARLQARPPCCCRCQAAWRHGQVGWQRLTCCDSDACRRLLPWVPVDTAPPMLWYTNLQPHSLWCNVNLIIIIISPRHRGSTLSASALSPQSRWGGGKEHRAGRTMGRRGGCSRLAPAA
jgi:hypothetical protein